ncbi:hypothetical protein EJ06DRAFT_528980 [Trichodelitschia bisporula]|uniref:Mitochondrial K+-H+ exchange-related-domain-containing protein n=1 Tax=Trichodelitschia bisporula TaxID=703511 RepID=A0A6G1I0Q0_9PEZI|nr:hypothetical protein EJ06DRAFT_528980 [Trichodelitschia bisporula]
MRLFLLPISARRTLIYCERPPPSPHHTRSYVDRLTTKASETWARFERAPSGWKKQLTVYGNAALRRIPFEEWGLKTIPSLSSSRRSKILDGSDAEPPPKIPVLFPPSFLPAKRVFPTLHTIATSRQPLHRQRLVYSLIGAPLTLPFALVPIIPNIPGFYLLFRAWSHWRAFSGARHLEFLVENGMVEPVPEPQLDEAYALGLKHATPEEVGENVGDISEVMKVVEGMRTDVDEERDTMLIRRWNGVLLAKRFGLPDMAVEIERAVEQVENAIAEDRKKESVEGAAGKGASPADLAGEKKHETK